MVNLDGVIGRLKKIRGISQDKDIALLLGISAPDLSNRKKRGTLLPLIIDLAINENVNLHWLITGKDSKASVEILDPNPEVAELMEGARRVLKSGNTVAFDALERNIRYFDYAIKQEKRMAEMEKRLRALEKQKNREKLSEEEPSSGERAA